MSAGENVEVTLPRNGVELNVFVVPPPPNGKIKTTAWFYFCRWKNTFKFPRDCFHIVKLFCGDFALFLSKKSCCHFNTRVTMCLHISQSQFKGGLHDVL